VCLLLYNFQTLQVNPAMRLVCCLCVLLLCNIFHNTGELSSGLKLENIVQLDAIKRYKERADAEAVKVNYIFRYLTHLLVLL